jgi:hypothetical protein
LFYAFFSLTPIAIFTPFAFPHYWFNALDLAANDDAVKNVQNSRRRKRNLQYARSLQATSVIALTANYVSHRALAVLFTPSILFDLFQFLSHLQTP